jgi:cytochrome c oxidase cbb3-type subunit III
MPSFKGRLDDQQVWQLVSYVRSLSGLAPMDAAPSRPDHMFVKPPNNRMKPQEAMKEGSH